MKQYKKKNPKVPLNSFCVAPLLPPLSVVCIHSETPGEERGFSFLSIFQLEIACGLGWGLISTSPSWCWDPKETFLPVTQTETFHSVFPPTLSPLSGDLIRSPIETNPVHFPYIAGVEPPGPQLTSILRGWSCLGKVRSPHFPALTFSHPFDSEGKPRSCLEQILSCLFLTNKTLMIIALHHGV